MAVMKPERQARLRGLYAITPEMPDGAWLCTVVVAALDGGASLVQYRSKGLAPAQRAGQARALSVLCRARGIPFIVNDDVELARAVAADGVHLGRDDADPAAVRAIWPDAILGVSCYGDPLLARIAAAAGADYVGIGSVFGSPTKPLATRAALDCLAQAKRESGLPVAAIGGIRPDNAALARAAGADMLAVISSLFEATDVTAAARALCLSFHPDPATHV
jgi:thiamine-phosphate pyrophosphorylase